MKRFLQASEMMSMTVGRSASLAASLTAFLLLLYPVVTSHAAPGALDLSFGTSGKATADLNFSSDMGQAVAIYASGTHAGKVVIAGTYTSGSVRDMGVVRLNANGSLDTTFNSTGKVIVDISGYDYGLGVAIQSDDKIVVAGTANNNLGMIRLNANGTLDTTFNSTGKLTRAIGDMYSNWNGVAIQSDGKILVCGYRIQGGSEQWSTVLRLNSNGSADVTMSANFYVSAASQVWEGFNKVAIQSDGKIVAVGFSSDGSTNRAAIARFTTAGALDTTFNTTGQRRFNLGNGSEALKGVAIQSDGKIVAAGQATGATNGDFAICRLTAAGALDTTFDTDGINCVDVNGSSDEPYGLVMQSDGKFIVAGMATGGSNFDFAALRFNAGGSLDTGFGSSGKVFVDFGDDDRAYGGAALTADGKIVLAGWTGPDGQNRQFAAARLHSQSSAMVYCAAAAQQNVNPIAPASTGDIIALKVTVTGDLTPLSASNFQFNTAGSTNPGTDISQAALYYTGTSKTFSTGTPVGSGVSNPNGAFTISGSQALVEGENYFWIAYTLRSTATIGNVVDAQCSQVTVGGSARTPSPTSPAGNRTVSNLLGYYNIASSNPSAGATFLAPTGAAGGVTMSNLTIGPGIQVITVTPEYYDNGSFSFGQWTTAASRDAQDYYQCQLTANAGKRISYQAVTFGMSTDNYDAAYSGPKTVELRASTDNFISSDILIYTITFSGSLQDMEQQIFSNINLASLVGVKSGTVTFRWYGYNRPGTDPQSALSLANAPSGGSNFKGTGSNLIFNGSVEDDTYTISGTVRDGSSNPIPGVTITFSHNSHTETTDANGNYSYAVAAGVSTVVTPSKSGYGSWSPASYTLNNISANQTGKNFSGTVIQYTVAFRTDGTPGATLTGTTTQTVNHGASCSAVTANVPTGYHFVNWTGTGGFSSSANPVTVTNVTQNMTITANYAINQYTVAFQTDGTPGATLTGNPTQMVNHGANCSAVTANVPTGYHFVNWTGTSGFVSANNPVTVTNVTQNKTITANYAINQHSVAFQTDGTPGATLTGTTTQTVNHGASCSAVTANAPTGYHFVNWTGTGGFSSSANPVTVTNVTQNMTITANYAVNQYTVAFQTDGTPGATLTGTTTQTVNHSASCSAVTANVPTGYHFVNWTGTGGFISTSNPVTVTNVTQNKTITANYAINQYTVVFRTDGTPGATLGGTTTQTVNHGGSTGIVTAYGVTGYVLLNWTGTGGFSSTNNPVTVTNVRQDMTITANYVINHYTVVFVTDNTPGATLTGTTTQTVNHGSSCASVTANNPTGYSFVNWTGTGGLNSANNPLTVTNVTQNMTITAHYAINQYTVIFQTNGAPDATLTGTLSQNIMHGGNCSAVTANAPEGFHLVNWTGTGGFISTDNPVTVMNVTQDMTITANFAINSYTVEFLTDGTPDASLTGNLVQIITHGGNCEAVLAEAPAGHHFADWIGTGGFVSTDNPVVVTNVLQDMTVIADFKINIYSLTYAAGEHGSISGATTQSACYGSSGTPVTATADAGYHFTQWSDGLTDNPRQDVNVAADINVTASFDITTHTLTVASASPDSGIAIGINPPDILLQGDGETQFTRIYAESTTVTLTAPLVAPDGNLFYMWLIDGRAFAGNTARTVQALINSDRTMTAVYYSDTPTLTIASQNPDSGVAIAMYPPDKAGIRNGVTLFSCQYDRSSLVTLTAPPVAPNSWVFSKWLKDGFDFANNAQRSALCSMDTDHTMTAVYVRPPSIYFLTVNSQDSGSSVVVENYPADRNNRTSGTTQFVSPYTQWSLVTLTAAPLAPNGYVFSKWLKDGADFSNNSQRAALCSMGSDHTMTAVYAHPANTSLLTVASTATAGDVIVAVYPADRCNRTTGTTQFVYPYAPWSLITLTAPAVAPNGYVFQKWLKDGADFANNTGRAALCSMGADHVMMAVYVHPSNTRLLTVASSNPDSGVAIAIYPTDKNGRNSGVTQFVSSYAPNVLATLTAPASAPNGNRFVKWLRDGQDFSNNAQPAVVCPMNADRAMTAVYSAAP